jgi:hypothetical protein
MSVNALLFTELVAPAANFGRAAGAYRIATEIRYAGYTCQVIDFFTKFTEEEMSNIMSTFIGEDTLIVGFSSTFFEKAVESPQADNVPEIVDEDSSTMDYPFDLNKMRIWIMRMKKINRNLKIVFGGAKTSYMTAMCDAFAHGYCDLAVVEYMKFLEGKNPEFNHKEIHNGQISFNGSNFPEFDFNSSTIDWHPSDHLQHGEVVPIEIARGCIFKCKFCAYPLNGKKKLDFIKHNSVLRDEFLRNYQEYGITRYIYADDTHNDTVEKLERLHRVVNSLPFEIEYAAYLRHDLIYSHKHTAALMRESGLRSCFFGVESLNYKSAQSIGKGIHPEKTKELFHWLRSEVWKDDVSMSAGFIVGLPHETPESVREWSQWLLADDCPLHTFDIHPLYMSKGAKVWQSEFERDAMKYGYILYRGGHWRNDHFTFQTACDLVAEITEVRLQKEKFGAAAFRLIMLGNLGFSPADIVVNKINNSLIYPGRRLYINNYKERLLQTCVK